VREQLDALAREMFDRGILLADAVAELEKRFIARALHVSAGNIGHAAARLGLHRNTLSRKMREHRIRRPGA
jgi:DNA-binding NtrC family response regulator